MVADPTRVLVTGGAGFIGSHIVDAMVAGGYRVAVIDSLVTGDAGNLVGDAALHQVDIRDPQAVDRVFAEFRPQLVNHHAAQISVSESARDPVADATANIIGSLVLLEACRRHGVEHVTFASTGGALYGEPARVPAGEDMLIRPLSPYGAAKASVEAYLHVYRQTWGLASTILRYANVYGPRQSALGEAGVIAIVTRKMLRGEQPTVFGDGEQTRDFVYVADVVEANMIAAKRRMPGAFNVGTGIPTSVNQIVAELASLTGYAGERIGSAERLGDVRAITLDATLLTETTGWAPVTAVADGLRAVVEHMRAATGASG